MERIKPIDLERTQFNTTLKGYDKTQVDDVVRQAAHEIETLLMEIKSCRERCGGMDKEIQLFRSQESLLKEALVLAQKAADDTRANARREADQIVSQARQDASHLHAEGHLKLNEITWEIERLQGIKRSFESGLRSLVGSHLSLLEERSRLDQPPPAFTVAADA